MNVLLVDNTEEQTTDYQCLVYDDHRSIVESNVEDLVVIAQPLPEDVEGASP